MGAEEYLAIEKTSRGELTELEKKIPADVSKKIKDLETQLNELQGALEQKVETIARHVFEELRSEYDEELKQLQREFSERYKEQHPSPETKPQLTKEPKEKLESKPKQKGEEKPPIDIFSLLEEAEKRRKK